MSTAVVMPVLDEGRIIEEALAELDGQGFEEIVVVDGGSRDDTVARARAAGARVITADRGRGPQQNAGAAATTSPSLLFLHADVRLPRGAREIIEATLREPGVVAGAFRVHHVGEGWRGKRREWLLRVADVRSRVAALPYGDQGIFVSREIFHQVGGFPEIPLMEDLELSKRLARCGTIRVVPHDVLASGRRFESATLRQCVLMNIFPTLYRLGVPAETLSRLYGDPR